ncbi:hypothetical protein JL193_08330 [Polaribacter batillariae]|uniref:Outer membrane protein beta-barrel domain-containing protein n=1 Tax=Polaribacter batillariae TaxID=2808900 RepID=A0ABX7T173_9FLAO|nr:hypothetical protein [Polaribacter batillariae]QTD39228.1 hypothetical protein JL193_08330 [Polaribacter batillariae]
MKNITFLLFLMIFSSVNAQENLDYLNTKNNPIIYMGMNLGFTSGELGEFNASFDLNYQHKNNLFTFKYSTILDVENIRSLYFVPIPNLKLETKEYSLLYGKRYIKDKFSYHFSGGISYSSTNDKNLNETFNYIGFPLEIGVNWFKPKKKKFSVLFGLIPVGKPTGFGRSFGVKLYANIAKKSYVGLGLNFSLGWHKKY